MAKAQAQLGLAIKMLLEKITPGALRYMEVNEKGEQVKAADGAKIGTLYIRKESFSGDVPKAISVTVSW